MGRPSLSSNPKAELRWRRILGEKSRVAYFRQVYGTYQLKDLEVDQFMNCDALEVFGRTSAEKSAGYGMGVILDLIQSCKSHLRQADREPRSASSPRTVSV